VSKGGDIPHLSPNNQVMAGNNFYFNGNEPLFSPNRYDTPVSDPQLDEVQRMQEELEKRKNALIAQNQHLISTKNNASRTPMWDEVDKFMQELSDSEYDSVSGSEEFKSSLARVMSIVQREEMKLILPYVEGCKDGKEAIEEHLATIKLLKKKISKQKEDNLELFNEYTQHYSDMTYTDFLAMKRKKVGSK
jgi:hypothetical protein